MKNKKTYRKIHNNTNMMIRLPLGMKRYIEEVSSMQGESQSSFVRHAIYYFVAYKKDAKTLREYLKKY